MNVDDEAEVRSYLASLRPIEVFELRVGHLVKPFRTLAPGGVAMTHQFWSGFEVWTPSGESVQARLTVDDSLVIDEHFYGRTGCPPMLLEPGAVVSLEADPDTDVRFLILGYLLGETLAPWEQRATAAAEPFRGEPLKRLARLQLAKNALLARL
jgi:hypothetical protein